MLEKIESKLAELGLELPTPPEAKGNYLPYSVSGNLVTLSGTLPIKDGEVAYTGKVGAEQTIEDGYEAARLCTLNALANLRAASDDFNNLVKFVHVNGFVNGVEGFAASPAVINGASDLLAELFGDIGRHSRAAVSVNGLPLNSSVEVQISAEIC